MPNNMNNAAGGVRPGLIAALCLVFAVLIAPAAGASENSADPFNRGGYLMERPDIRKEQRAEGAEPAQRGEKAGSASETAASAPSPDRKAAAQTAEASAETNSVAGVPPAPAAEADGTKSETAENVGETEEEPRFEITRNKRVNHYVKRFSSEKARKDFARYLDRSGKYLPDIRETLREERVPQEIAYLPLIESGFNPRAVSRKRAVGLWQFIKPTGKRYGLRINHWVDERMNSEKSTRAAARYLRDLYDEFGSWELALAAYNCGERRVARAIARTGSEDFWKISRKLPRETRNYVPKFNAALIIALDPGKYGFDVPGTEKDYEAVTVPPRKSLAEIAELLGMGYRDISKHNPSLVGLSTPPGKNYSLKVPKGYGDKLLSFGGKVKALKDVRHPFRTRPTKYTVRRNDSLWKIARKFGTSVDRLRIANRLSGSTIRPGQRLTIPAKGNIIYVKHRIRPGENIHVLAKRYGTTVGAIKRANNLKGSLIVAGKTLSIPQKVSSAKARRGGVLKKMRHRISPGDTLSALALRYRVSVSQIKKWNNMSSSRLIAGRSIVIYK